MLDTFPYRSIWTMIYSRFCLIAMSGLLVLAAVSIGMTIFFPQMSATAIGKTISAFDQADACIGGHIMQQKSLKLFGFEVSSKYYDERCADTAAAIQIMATGTAGNKSDMIVLSLNVLRSVSDRIDKSSSETIGLLYNDNVNLSGIDGSKCAWSSWDGEKSILISMQCPKG